VRGNTLYGLQGHQLEVSSNRHPCVVADRGPYIHAGQFATLEEVLNHYKTAPADHTELESLNLSEKQIAQIIVLLKTLDSPVDAEPQWLQAP
jgi:cytochrome c peroxidase